MIDCHGNPTEANAWTSQVAAPFQYYVNSDDLRAEAWNGLLHILRVPISSKQNNLRFLWLSAWLEAMKLSSQLLKNALFPVARWLITLKTERKHNRVLVNWSRNWQSGHPPSTEDQTESQKLGTRYPLESRWKRLSWYLRLNTHHCLPLTNRSSFVLCYLKKELSFASKPWQHHLRICLDKQWST